MFSRLSLGTAVQVGAEEFLPSAAGARCGIDELRAASAGCRGCELYLDTTQTVFGDGDPTAELMLVGEQPGDREDLEGEPFVGPAGRVLDEALQTVGISRDRVWMTNAVKHFRHERRGAGGKVRLHKKPTAAQVAACRPWLLAELSAVQPRLVVCLGATAAQSLLGPKFRVTREHGVVLPGPDQRPALATVHPSSILRAPDAAARHQAMAGFVADLEVAVDWLAAG